MIFSDIFWYFALVLHLTFHHSAGRFPMNRGIGITVRWIASPVPKSWWCLESAQDGRMVGLLLDVGCLRCSKSKSILHKAIDLVSSTIFLLLWYYVQKSWTNYVRTWADQWWMVVKERALTLKAQPLLKWMDRLFVLWPCMVRLSSRLQTFIFCILMFLQVSCTSFDRDTLQSFLTLRGGRHFRHRHMSGIIQIHNGLRSLVMENICQSTERIDIITLFVGSGVLANAHPGPPFSLSKHHKS